MKKLFLVFLAFSLGFSSYSQIQTNAVKKASRLNKKDDYRKLSDDNGFFLMPHFGIRYGQNPDPSFSGLEDLSLYYGLGLVYRKENLSLESGLSLYHHTSSAVYFPIWEREEYVMNSDLASVVLPFTFRYDIPTGAQGNIRFGAFFTGNVAIISLEGNDDSRSGRIQGENGAINYTLVSKSKSPFFFKTGIHSRIRFFNSSFLNLELGQFFTLSANREYTLTLGDALPRKIDRRWEGLTWSFGGILPLSVFEKKFRKVK
ncbi:hypothetical protein [Algoriphagus litoralis]|uniref:hypothetical protein n=1 Tax=Algoriphagus litoralis TaxID=2202829 RepID=UPI000DB9E651|nr:hypothetical protein [Algoriphagus litoralis]